MARKPGKPYGLPGYEWGPQTQRYRNLSTGRFVARADINNLLTEVVNGSGDRLARLAVGMQRGELTGRQAYELMAREVKHAYNGSVALARGGWDRVPLTDFGRNGELLQVEYQRLVQFAQDVADGKVSELQAASRGRLYADSAFQRYWQIWQEQQRQMGFREEKWETAKDSKVCPQCVALEAQGWVPLDSLPIAGSVHAGCRCSKETR